VATWNIHSCTAGVQRVADLIRSLDADLIALQEVDRGTRRSGFTDQAATIARLAGYPEHRFFKAVDWRPGDYGVALLSRWPMTQARVGMLPCMRGTEQRILASTLVEHPHGTLAVHVTHLTPMAARTNLRVLQARRVAHHLRDAPAPQLLFGDFNDVPGSQVHRVIRDTLVDVFEAVGAGPGGTYDHWLLPARRIDYIWASGDIQLHRAWVVATDASDHHALAAEVRLPAQARPLLAMIR